MANGEQSTTALRGKCNIYFILFAGVIALVSHLIFHSNIFLYSTKSKIFAQWKNIPVDWLSATYPSFRCKFIIIWKNHFKGLIFWNTVILFPPLQCSWLFKKFEYILTVNCVVKSYSKQVNKVSSIKMFQMLSESVSVINIAKSLK